MELVSLNVSCLLSMPCELALALAANANYAKHVVEAPIKGHSIVYGHYLKC